MFFLIDKAMLYFNEKPRSIKCCLTDRGFLVRSARLERAAFRVGV